jgi:hypothetical protein
VGGGGGGGAILIASSTRIDLPSTGRVYSKFPSFNFNDGSGGAIRLVAPIVAGNGAIDVTGGYGGNGRVRIDSLANNLTTTPSGSFTAGRFMVVFPTPLPRLDIMEAAGTIIPEGTNGVVQVLLPYNSDTNRTVTLQARDFGAVVAVDLLLTPDAGSRQVYALSITNTAGNNPAQVVVPVVIPVNTLVTIHAWTR